MAAAPPDTGDQFARIAPHYDQLMASVPYALWVDYLCELALLSHRPVMPEARVLDLATGTGSVALEFARRGHPVTGLDLSRPMLAVAERKARTRGLSVKLLARDLRRFALPAEFDLAVCLYDSLNYILDPDDLKRAFGNIRNALRPSGVLIFDVNTVHALEAELFTQTSPLDAPVRYRWQSKYDPQTRLSTVQMHFEIRETQEKIDIVHRQRAYTDMELRSFLSHAGFGSMQSYDGYRFSPPTVTSDRVFYVALPR